MVIADDWSPIAGCYGEAAVPTPRIDGLAQRATVFDRSFCTSPSCAASRASILTGMQVHQHGQYGHCHGIHGFRTRDDAATLPQLAQARGVRAELIGKNHTAPASVYPWHDRAGEPATPDGWRRRVGQALAHNGPTFTMVAPHYPHRGGPDGWNCHAHAEAFGDGPIDPASVTVPDFLPDLPEVRADLAGYWRAIGRYDACVGAALDAIADQHAEDDTLVIVTTDHAMPFVGAKASCYDTGHRCPLLVARPGGAAGRCATPVNWLDFFPTIRTWLDLPEPEDGHPRSGRSLLPLLDGAGSSGGDWAGRTIIASHCFHEVTMADAYRFIHDGRWKFVQRLQHGLPMPMPSDLFDSRSWQAICDGDIQQLGQRRRSDYTHRPAEALYDLDSDPMETRDASADHPAIRDRLRAALIDDRIRTGDPWLMLDYQRGLVPAQARQAIIT